MTPNDVNGLYETFISRRKEHSNAEEKIIMKRRDVAVLKLKREEAERTLEDSTLLLEKKKEEIEKIKLNKLRFTDQLDAIHVEQAKFSVDHFCLF